ncbi:beta-N-acetylhexosaminidase [Deinococcus aquaedulcis]|uniref:beta-N-acetylhexosaminidase n=1 Tax=Deinococcus aquaedulcis TaxID=2840455 RepID=UPI001C83DF24|nr:beta-N-acetylhexosaminidase [Deinococcus aquaedulcis]
MKRMLLWSAALWSPVLGAPALAAPVTLSPTPEARVVQPAQALVPAPQQATFPAGTLALTGLGLRVVGAAPELGWAARDLRAEWQTRLGQALPDTAGPGPSVVIGTVADPELAARARAAGLVPRGPEGYALWVDGAGAAVVGATPAGAYLGTQTLRQLLTPAGLRYARIQDAPTHAQRIGMIYLDQYSKGVNDRLIPLLAALKYNAVLVMSNYVQWDVARAGGWAHPGGASKAEARRVAELARSHGLEVIPLVETLSHVGWMFYGGKNLDLRQDPDSQNPWAYDTLNPETYTRVIFPVLKEAVEVFGPRRLHLGHDEVRNRDRFPARENGKAVGFEKLFVDDVQKLHGFLKAQGVDSMIWHDTAFADAVIGTLPAQLPRDLQVAYWNYAPGTNFPMLARIQALGFPVLGASWWEGGNAEGHARAALAAGAGGMIQTRWTGYFGNPSVWDGNAEQLAAFVRAAGAFWNPAAPPVADEAGRYRDLYQPGSYRAQAGATVNLAPLVTRTLADNDGSGWIGKGEGIDLRHLRSGVQRLGAYLFDVQGAVMLRGSRASVKGLPERAEVELNRKATGLAFLHTTGWPAALNREKVGEYVIEYEDGSRAVQPLEYGRHIRAWTDTAATSMVPAPGWSGVTGEGLAVAVPVLEWVNPKPNLTIRRVTLVSAGGNANPALLGLTVLGP